MQRVSLITIFIAPEELHGNAVYANATLVDQDSISYVCVKNYPLHVW